MAWDKTAATKMGLLRALGLERYRVSKLKPHLKMAEQRLAILNSKKTNLIKTQKREIAQLLRDGKEEKARIRVEKLIRDDFTIEAYELLSLLCELLHERAALITSEKDCPPDLREACCTLIWAAPRTEVPELKVVAEQLDLKYGKEFFNDARKNVGERANVRVVHKLGVAPPSAYLVVKYLKAIAEEYKVQWEVPDLDLSEEQLETSAMPAPSGYSVPVAPGSGLEAVYERAPVPPPSPPPPVAVVNPAASPVGTVVGVVPPEPPVATVVPPPPTQEELRAKDLIDAKLAEGRTFTKPAYFPEEPDEEEDESKDDAPPDAVSDLEARLNALRR